jgi:hypothetical protein
VETVIQRLPFGQLILSLHHLLPVQTACQLAPVAPRDLPTQPPCRVLCTLVECLRDDPLSSLSGAHNIFVGAGPATAAPAAASTTVDVAIDAVEVQRGTGLTY